MSSSKELTEQWYNDTSNRAHLELLLRDPVLVLALRILNAKASEPVPAPHAAVDLIQYGALIGYTRNGAFETLKNLEALSKNQPRPVPEAKAFEHAEQRRAAGIREETAP